jgi:adenine deaminase
MAIDEAHKSAEEKIEEARRSDATELDLSGLMSDSKLTELAESLGRLVGSSTCNG